MAGQIWWRRMQLLLRAAAIVTLLLAIRGARWAYVAFVVLSLLSFPAHADFHFIRPACELLVTPQLALFSFRNVPHILLFAPFFLVSRVQLAGPRASMWAFVATLAMGALVELAEGVSGQGHCRLRDLLPDAAGATLGWVALAFTRRFLHRQRVAA
jgi:hypothetical protein